MANGLYLRVSSNKGQDTKSQEPDLQTWAKAQGEEIVWYKDKFTGTTMERPGLERLLADVRSGKVKKVVVWRLDRLGRTAKGLLTLLDELQSLGIGFVSLREGFDLGTPAGRLMAGVLASVAAYETEVRKERQLGALNDALVDSGMTFEAPIKDFSDFEKLEFKGQNQKYLDPFLKAMKSLAKATIADDAVPSSQPQATACEG